MKASLYNSFIRISDNCSLIYNALTGRFFPIKHSTPISETTLLDNKDSKLYRSFIDAGILVEDSRDELSELKQRIINADDNRDEFILHINPTLDCNFKCWYCYENHMPHSKMDEATLLATKAFIENVVGTDIKRFHLGFFGGEPLFHFHFIAKHLIEYSAALCAKRGVDFYVHFTSNGALLNNSIIEFLSQYSCAFQITLDGHKEDHDKTRFFKNGVGSYERIIRNILQLIDSGISVIARINYTSENIDKSSNVLGYFKHLDTDAKELIRFDFQRVWQEKSIEEDKTERKAHLVRGAFKKAGFIVLPNYIPHNVSDSCYGDKINHILINYDGLIFGCTARDFIEANSIGILNKNGNITYKEPSFTMRRTAKFSNPICHTCRIAPICGGGCRQRAMEAIDCSGCPMGYSEDAKDDKVLDLFENTYNINSRTQ